MKVTHTHTHHTHMQAHTHTCTEIIQRCKTQRKRKGKLQHLTRLKKFDSKSCLRFLKSPKVRNYGSSFNHALVNFTFCGVGALADCPKLPTDKLKNSFSKWYIFYGEKDTFNPNYLVTSISLYFPNCSFNSSETILLLYQCSNPLLGLV